MKMIVSWLDCLGGERRGKRLYKLKYLFIFGGLWVGKDQREKAVIVGSDEDGSLDELAALVEAAGGRVVERLVLRRTKPDPAFFLTEGELWELKGLVGAKAAALVVFDD